MPPVHIAPFLFKRIVLIEKMIFPVVPYKAVRIIVPAPFLGVVHLRPVVFPVEAVADGYAVVLIDFTESGSVFGI